MPKNKGKGGKNRRRGKNDSEEKRELEFKDDGQEYAQVLRMLGNGRCEVQCFDGVKRLAHIRGKMRKKSQSAVTSTDNTMICLTSLPSTVYPPRKTHIYSTVTSLTVAVSRVRSFAPS